MNCRELCDLLCDYVNGELSVEICTEVRAHLEICPPCLHYCETYRLTVTLTRRLPPAPMPQEVAERLLARICNEAEPKDENA